MIKFNAKDSEIVATPLCLGNISGQYIIWKKLDQMGMFMILLLIKYDHKLLMKKAMSLCFFLLVLKQVNAVVVVTT